ncbi:laccase [Suillus subaureus]|uniref:laccase n=1 Tax=Suillus subaureus TaxID=48587 RepID=A0A9P7EC67_9AGAM|nr:laccase [Suillus subaureus]KAG1817498.1 laccase [Suillus subaureus]
MFILLLLVYLVSSINAASIVSRSQSHPLSQPAVLGPKTRITIGNKVIAPDGFERPATVVNGIFPGPLIAAQKGDDFAIEVVNELKDESMFKSTSVVSITQLSMLSLIDLVYCSTGTVSSKMGRIMPMGHHSSHNAPLRKTTLFYILSPLRTRQAPSGIIVIIPSNMKCDGLRGPLVIYDPHDPLAHMYDVDDASTVITLSDWYHVVAPVLRHIIGTTANSSLINGLGRYAGGPMSELAVISVEQGKRYRMRLVSTSCDPNFYFSIDGHNLTVIEADGQLTEPLLVDELRIFAGQRYSVVLVADKPVDNYWIRNLPDIVHASYEGGTNSAILRYQGAPDVDPTTVNTTSANPLKETDLHALINPGAPGIPEYGKADINLNLSVTSEGGIFYVNNGVSNVTFQPPNVPVLLQILSGAQEPSQLLPNGSVIVLEANKVVELTLSTTGAGGPHPIHLHGHSFDVVQSAGSKTFNYANPVRRDVVSAGSRGEHMVIRWTTDNSGPWFLHCHIDWHLDAGFAAIMAESPSDTRAHLNTVPQEWHQLCPIFDSLTPTQLGGGGRESYQEASSITTLLFPPSPLP